MALSCATAIIQTLKTYNVKNIFLSLSILLCSLSAFATGEWKTYFKNSEVEIQYCYTDCHDIPNGLHQQKILLRFINFGSKPVEVFYTKELTFSNSMTKPDVREFSVHLNGGETLAAECETKDSRLYIFSKQLNFNSTSLKHFELKDISVKAIQ